MLMRDRYVTLKNALNMSSNNKRVISKTNPHADSMRRMRFTSDMPENCRSKENEVQHPGLGRAILKGFSDSANKLYILDKSSPNISVKQIGKGFHCTTGLFTKSMEDFSGAIIHHFCEVRDKILNDSVDVISRRELAILYQAIALDRLTSHPIYFNKISEKIELIPDYCIDKFYESEIPIPYFDIDINSEKRFDMSCILDNNKDTDFYWLDIFKDTFDILGNLYVGKDYFEYCNYLNILKKSEIKIYPQYFRDMIMENIIINISKILAAQSREVHIIKYNSSSILRGDNSVFAMKVNPNNEKKALPLHSITSTDTLILFGLAKNLLLVIAPQHDSPKCRSLNTDGIPIIDNHLSPIKDMDDLYNQGILEQTAHHIYSPNEMLLNKYKSHQKKILFSDKLEQTIILNEGLFDSRVPISTGQKFHFTVDALLSKS